MKIQWGKLGGLLGIGYCLAGLFLIFLGWNGAASYDREPAQLPYVVSGGIGGLALVVIGASLLIVQSQRADRTAFQASIEDLRTTIERAGGVVESERLSTAAAATSAEAAGEVVAGPTSYHRPDCRLVAGQRGVAAMTLSAAISRGLDACRICAPTPSPA
ncbi:MAG: hypothetical protein ACRDWD_09895 [Acidimicrobiia bacterium]